MKKESLRSLLTIAIGMALMAGCAGNKAKMPRTESAAGEQPSAFTDSTDTPAPSIVPTIFDMLAHDMVRVEKILATSTSASMRSLKVSGAK